MDEAIEKDSRQRRPVSITVDGSATLDIIVRNHAHAFGHEVVDPRVSLLFCQSFVCVHPTIRASVVVKPILRSIHSAIHLDQAFLSSVRSHEAQQIRHDVSGTERNCFEPRSLYQEISSRKLSLVPKKGRDFATGGNLEPGLL
eukprot:745634-Rhodomonas_salina.1